MRRSEKTKLRDRLPGFGSEDHTVKAEKAWQAVLADPKQGENLSRLSEEDLEELHQQILDPNSDITKLLGQMTEKEVSSLCKGLDKALYNFCVTNPPYLED